MFEEIFKHTLAFFTLYEKQVRRRKMKKVDNVSIMKYIRNILNTKIVEAIMSKKLKIAAIGGECVACGCCITVCPREAIHIKAGITAFVHEKKCIGCGKCAKTCPADVITITERRMEA